MLFYTTWILTGLIVTLVLLGLYKFTVIVTRKVFKANQPHGKVGRSKKMPNPILGSTSRHWSGNGNSTPMTMARAHPAVPDKAIPWGWPTNNQMNDEFRPKLASSKEANLNTYLTDHYVNPKMVATGKPNIDRLGRDSRPEFNGSVYKEARKATSKNLHDNVNGKPWGW